MRFRRWAWGVPALIYLVPLGVSVWLGVAEAVDAAAWSRLWADSQLPSALGLSLWVALTSTALVLGLTMLVVTNLHGSVAWQRLQASIGGLLAVPHAAFAIGLALLLMPSGLIARVIAWFAGWSSPPDVATVQDPWGLGLIAGLVLKELPFLLWNVAAQLERVLVVPSARNLLDAA